MSTVTANLIYDVFSEVADMASKSVSSVSGTVIVNNSSVQLSTVTYGKRRNTSVSPPRTEFVFGGTFNISSAPANITDISFTAKDSGGSTVLYVEVATTSTNPIVVNQTGLYAVVLSTTIVPPQTVTIQL